MKLGEPQTRETALREICQRYWRPLYSYCRCRGLGVEDAEDATQGFFEQLLRLEVFERMGTGGQGRMRSFLLTGMQNWLAKQHRHRTALKRGGAVLDLPLDFAGAEAAVALQVEDGKTPEVLYERRWAETLLLEARRQLKADYETAGKAEILRVLSPHLAGDEAAASMAEIGAELGVTEGHARVLLHRLRKHYRAALREEIARTVETEDEVEEEMRHLRRVLLG